MPKFTIVENQTKCGLPARALAPLHSSKHYMLTIKCNYKKSMTRLELDNEYARIVKRLPGIEYSDKLCYEEDTEGRTHIHTTCIINGKLPLFSKLSKKGWHINFTQYPPEHHKMIQSYINKHQQTEAAIDQLFDLNQYRFDNQFGSP